MNSDGGWQTTSNEDELAKFLLGKVQTEEQHKAVEAGRAMEAAAQEQRRLNEEEAYQRQVHAYNVSKAYEAIVDLKRTIDAAETWLDRGTIKRERDTLAGQYHKHQIYPSLVWRDAIRERQIVEKKVQEAKDAAERREVQKRLEQERRREEQVAYRQQLEAIDVVSATRKELEEAIGTSERLLTQIWIRSLHDSSVRRFFTFKDYQYMKEFYPKKLKEKYNRILEERLEGNPYRIWAHL